MSSTFHDAPASVQWLACCTLREHFSLSYWVARLIGGGLGGLSGEN